MNKIILTGNLTKDPELLETQSGISYCRLSLAVSRRNGETKETDFYNGITAWRGQADTISKHFRKGNPILIEGNIGLRDYEDKDGNKRQAIDITLTSFEFMGGKKDEDKPKQESKPKPRLEPSDDFGEDSPF